MSLREARDDTCVDIHIPDDIDWNKLDKSKFFCLGSVLFSGVSGALYPIVVLKTRQQVLVRGAPCYRLAGSILKNEGIRGFYRGFSTSLMGTIPARSLYMGTLEIAKSNVSSFAVKFGFSEVSAAPIANAAAGLSAATVAQLVWTPVDVVSQRLMVQGGSNLSSATLKYSGGIDAFRKIVYSDGLRGLYRGFGISIFTYAPSNAMWWGSYSVANRLIWSGLGRYFRKKDEGGIRPSSTSVVAVQTASSVMASGVSALVTMPLDTVKTRMQVLDQGGGRPRVIQTVRNLVNDGGFCACYRGLIPRWISMSMSATTMITTYEFLKRMSTKKPEN
ncbi:solute carrier family 25 member 44-like [Heracleum sosnowskyi]|uniref:Solute carrier family 25 member 44-like n=1 Tax=Heracleum sosnowskyi TaxID=360622 RepID=A0AAD8HKX9_9APIA|nr:solute carrier family 25 member 44-like [Heracleum sosnowskyi]